MKNGKLKNEMCQWWLGHISKRVDGYVFFSKWPPYFLVLNVIFIIIMKTNRFLTEHGYVHNTLPDDYLNTPPDDMDSVFANQTLLGEIIAEEGEKKGNYGVEKLVEEVVGEVYEVVDGLKEEMGFMLEKKWAGLPLGVGWEGGGGGGTDIELEEGGEIMKRDYDYLVKMKKMDEEIEQAKKDGTREKKKLEMSDVVPVAGLVMARFHVYNCELNTATDHWTKMGEMAEKRSRKELELGKKRRESNMWAGVWKKSYPVQK